MWVLMAEKAPGTFPSHLHHGYLGEALHCPSPFLGHSSGALRQVVTMQLAPC